MALREPLLGAQVDPRLGGGRLDRVGRETLCGELSDPGEWRARSAEDGERPLSLACEARHRGLDLLGRHALAAQLESNRIVAVPALGE